MVNGVETLLSAGVVMVSGILLAGCSSPGSLRTVDVQQQISTALTKQVGGAFTVTCPPNLPAQRGYTFTCTVVDAEGGEGVTVTVTEDDDAGAFSWKVAPAGTP
jgi:hypothetical protein